MPIEFAGFDLACKVKPSNDAISANVVAVSVVSDDLAACVVSEVLKEQANPDEEWCQLVFRFFRPANGDEVEGSKEFKFALEGTLLGGFESYLQTFIVNDDSALVTATFQAGHYDEETGRSDGYLIKTKPKPSVERVFRNEFDLANNSASITYHNQKAFIIGTERDDGNPPKLISVELSSQQRSEKEWPHRCVRYAYAAAYNGYVWCLEQVNDKDKGIEHVLKYNLDSGKHEWVDIGPDPKKGHLKCAWSDANGVFQQCDYGIYALQKGELWLLDMNQSQLEWKYLGGPIGSGKKGGQFLTTSPSSLYVYDDGEGQFFKLELSRLK